ncbi:group II intron-encoding maturase variant [Symbiobacterium thermophilum IAM 14863]|uniref:Group II intron-encoding maturase variant n=1 Tax=Symbiobacterium thermophilum (strain DSM 24528 / JCM 14929 / IAM 14863 / T) TaxID=292459 RepID=Q67SS2_SYMTH|nr:group II intron-encoding maturase variant [Symbiobacterium thermophilum IAM 14863]
MERVVARENMLAALKRVERNGGAPGVDGVPTERLRDHEAGGGAGIQEYPRLPGGTVTAQGQRAEECGRPPMAATVPRVQLLQEPGSSHSHGG